MSGTQLSWKKKCVEIVHSWLLHETDYFPLSGNFLVKEEQKYIFILLLSTRPLQNQTGFAHMMMMSKTEIKHKMKIKFKNKAFAYLKQ